MIYFSVVVLSKCLKIRTYKIIYNHAQQDADTKNKKIQNYNFDCGSV
jgi:hypothetical protein